MTTLRTSILALLCSLAAVTALAGPSTRTGLLSVKDTIRDNNIFAPNSFETQIKDLQQHFILNGGYVTIDPNVDKKDAGKCDEKIVRERLARLNENTEIEMVYNPIVYSYIERYVKKSRSLVENMLGLSHYYLPIFEEALNRKGVPLELKYLPVIESAMNPNAVSPVGAAGLWQFMVGTGKGLGLEVSSVVDERRDVYLSSEKAAELLLKLHSIYNDWSLAIAAYNCGPGNVNKAVRRAGGTNGDGKTDFWTIYPYLPKETRGYVPAFIAAVYAMTYYNEHNITPSMLRKPLTVDSIHVNYRVSFAQIAHALNMSESDIQALNPQFRSNTIPGNPKRSYNLVLPSLQACSYAMLEDSIRGYKRGAKPLRYEVYPAGQESPKNVDKDMGLTTTSENANVEVSEQDIQEQEKQYEEIDYESKAAEEKRQQDAIEQEKQRQQEEAKRKAEEDAKKRSVTAVPARREQPKPAQPAVPERNAAAKNNTNTQADAAKKKAEQEAAKKKAEEAAKKKAAEEAAKKKAAEEAAKKKAAEDAAKKKAAEDAAKKKAAANTANTGNKATANTGNKATTNTGNKAAANTGNKATTNTGNKAAANTGNKATTGATGKAAEARPTTNRTTTHEVKEGDNLTKIAEKNGVSVEELKKANNKKDDVIKPGEKLTIPKKK
ncbi:MAG: transglycosylase SLT domain-containing protein [Muribaculaceae bacterium]|nr:transglycosylase SLT domain-containing protein [Muribaculaceae bacterium]